MIEVRKNVFETNSSSTHALCIARNPKTLIKDQYDTVRFRAGEFGWGVDRLVTVSERASYLYMMAVETGYDIEVFKARVTEVLESIGVEAEFDDLIYDGRWLAYGYIDHGYEWSTDMQTIMSDYNLINFLFNDQSFVLTDNDNQEGYEDRLAIMESRISGEYDIYEKGN